MHRANGDGENTSTPTTAARNEQARRRGLENHCVLATRASAYGQRRRPARRWRQGHQLDHVDGDNLRTPLDIFALCLEVGRQLLGYQTQTPVDESCPALPLS